MAQSTSGMEVARVRSGLLCGTWEPVTPMRREKYKGRKPSMRVPMRSRGTEQPVVVMKVL